MDTEPRGFLPSAWFSGSLLRGWRFYFESYPSCSPVRSFLVRIMAALWGVGLLLEGRVYRIWLLILAGWLLLSFLCTLMRTLGTVHAPFWAFMTPVTVLQGYLAGGGPWRKGLGFELGASPSGPFRVYAADYSLPSGRCSFNHITGVVYLYFTTEMAFFANVNKTKSITRPSESAVNGF